jgi:hypothetical protein
MHRFCRTPAEAFVWIDASVAAVWRSHAGREANLRFQSNATFSRTTCDGKSS